MSDNQSSAAAAQTEEELPVDKKKQDYVPIYERFIKRVPPQPEGYVFPPKGFPEDPKLENPVYFHEQVCYAVQEKYVIDEEMRQLRAKITACWWKNGIKAQDACKDVIDDYAERLKYTYFYLPKEVQEKRKMQRVQKIVEQKRKERDQS